VDRVTKCDGKSRGPTVNLAAATGAYAKKREFVQGVHKGRLGENTNRHAQVQVEHQRLIPSDHRLGGVDWSEVKPVRPPVRSQIGQTTGQRSNRSDHRLVGGVVSGKQAGGH